MLVYDENSLPMARRDAGHALKSPRGRTHDVVVAPVGRFEVVPQGPFDLEVEARRFGGWPRLGDAVAMAFPVEGWQGSAAVLMHQRGNTIAGDVHVTGKADAQRDWRQALATVSLEVDGRGFAGGGGRASGIGRRAA